VEFNETSFDAWVDVAKAPALPSSLKLYNELQGLGFHIILLTGRSESQRNATEENLLFAGYHSWEKLILRYLLQFLHQTSQLLTVYLYTSETVLIG
jgi:predicted secreted acid phosphatase